MLDGLIKFLLIPILAAALGWALWDDSQQRSDLAVARTALTAAQAAKKTAEASEQQARTTLEKACARQSTISLQAGRTIQSIVDAAPRANGVRGLVGADRLRSVVGEP